MLVNYNDYKDGGSHKSFTISVVGENITVTNENMRQDSITLDEALCSERNLRFGCCESSQFSVHIANVFENFEGKQIQVSVTMDNKTTKYGTFKVKSDKPTADRIHRKLVAYDAMNDIINTNVLTWFKGLTFPITLKNFRDSFFSYLEITQETRSLINDDFVILGGFTASDSLSGRLIITSICELNGVFGHINRDGKFDYIDLTASSSFDCPPYENNSVKYEDYVTSAITKVTMRGTASDVGTSVGTDGNEYIIQGNPLIYGSEGKPALVTAMTRLLNKIKNVVFRPFELGKTIGNPCVELGDAISIETKYETIESYVLRRTLTGIQALRDKYSAEGDDVYPAGVSILQDEISRTKGKMLEIESSVDGLRIIAEEISEDLDENYYNKTEIDQTVEEITLAASQTYTEKSNAIKTDTIYYLATSEGSDVTRQTPGWTTTVQNISETNKYLWTYHLYTYDDDHTSPTDPVITGRWGDSGGTTAVYELQLSSAAINKSATANSYTPSTFALSAYYQVGTSAPTSYFGRFKIETTNDNSTWVAHYISSSDESYKAFTIPTTISGLKLIRCSLYMAGGTTTLLDQQTIPIVTDGSKGDKGDTGEKGDKGIKGDTGSPGAKGDKGDTGNAGADAYTVILANENHTFAGSNTAAIAASTECPVIAYKGSFQVPATIGTITGQPTGMTTTISYNGTINSRFSVEVTTSMVSKNGVLNVPVEVDGKTFNMKFTYSLALKGDTGTTARRYDLIVSNAAIGKDQSGNYNPASITLTAKYQDGTSSPANYSGRFKIETTTDNSTWTAKYTSSANESSKTFTIPTDVSGLKAVRCSLYLAGGTTTLLDQQTLPIVADGTNGTNGQPGANGKDAYTVILTNENHTFAGTNTAAIAGSTECAVVAYKGATQVAATIGTISGQPTGMTTSISGSGTTSAKFTVTVTTQMVTKNGVLTVPVTVDGKTFSMKFTYSLALKGDKGNTGDTGTGIVDVTPLWFCSSSSTAPTAPQSEVTRTDAVVGYWTKGIPALDSTNKYLYTCDQVHYDDSSVGTNGFTWTAVTANNAITNLNTRMSAAELKITDSAIVSTVTSSGQVTTTDQFNALSIGGTNLLKDTNAPSASKVDAAANRYIESAGTGTYTGVIEAITNPPVDGIKYGYHITQTTTDANHCLSFYNTQPACPKLVSGNEYTVSVYCKWISGSDAAKVRFQTYDGSTYVSNYDNTLIKDGKWHQYSWTFTANDAMATNGCRLYGGSLNKSNNTACTYEAMFCGWKMEAGNKATSWSEHPDHFAGNVDVNNKFSNYYTKSQIDQTASSITSTVEAYTDDALNSLQIGGENLLSVTPKLVQSSQYIGLRLKLTEKMVIGEKYTLQLWDVNVSHTGKTAQQLGVSVYAGGGYMTLVNFIGTDYFTNGHADRLTATFIAPDRSTYNNDYNNLYLNLYNSVPSASGTMSLTVGKWKLEKGDKATDYTTAPSDILCTGNIASANNISYYGATPLQNTPYVYSQNAGYGNGLMFASSLFTVGKSYVLSFKFKKTSGTLTGIGGHCSGFDTQLFVVDDVISTTKTYSAGYTLSNDANVHTVKVYLRYKGTDSNNNLYIQPNRGAYNTNNNTFDYWDITLEEGVIAHEWQPPEADRSSKSEVTQLSNKITLKVNSSGRLVTAALGVDPASLTSYVKVKADDIDIISNGNIQLTGKSIGIYSTNFQVTAAGAITAKSGLIGGWSIDSDKLYKSGTVSGTDYASYLKPNELKISAGTTGVELEQSIIKSGLIQLIGQESNPMKNIIIDGSGEESDYGNAYIKVPTLVSNDLVPVSGNTFTVGANLVANKHNGYIFKAGTKIVSATGNTSTAVFTNAQLNTLLGVTDSTNANTVVLASNGDGGAQAAHAEGCTYQNNTWYVTHDRATSTGNMRINYLVFYWG